MTESAKLIKHLNTLPEGSLIQTHNGTIYEAADTPNQQRAWYADKLSAGLSSENIVESSTSIHHIDMDTATAHNLSDEAYTTPFSISANHLQRQQSFSKETFGENPRIAGVLDHIQKELKEAAANPDDISEWADIIILSFDGAMRAGHAPQEILDAVLAKQEVNENRTWPDWKTANPNKAIEHIE